MKISIITPVYNAVNTFEKTILSVINQDIEAELEYIIIDGGSNDGTLEIINRYSDNIDILVSESDRGIYDAMNKGINLATGDIIGIINSDDWYNADALQIVEKIFKQEQEISILYSSIDNYLEGKYINTFIPGELKNLVFKFTLNHPSCFVKKSVYDKIGLFDLSYDIASDYDFIFRAYRAGFCFQYVPIPLVSYSLNGMSGKPLNKFKQISESWKITSEFAQQESNILNIKHRKFYVTWLLKELITFPLKLIIKPQILIQLKNLLREKIGSLPADRYGAW
ncbi:MAG: glycosyltransferase family 2 protein [Nostoc sp. ChiSLP01]|nr:glycosyltransferase family 2 protein [Nostoc sp. CmiSLP01]MDZ8288002.1 glycosyltransferase family 2 protein [Nostoc sp. ChiSLP01]